MNTPRNRMVLAGALVWVLVVFVIDVLTPLGVADWALYVPAILAAAPLGQPRFIVLVAALCTGLTIAGFFLSPDGVAPGEAALNRAMGLLALWLSAAAAAAIVRRSHQLSVALATVRTEVALRERTEAQLRDLMGQLEARVAERTRELEEKQRRVAAIVETAVEGIITINERGIIDSFNRAAEQMFGYTADEVLGRNVSVLMPSPDRERHDSYLANYLRTGEAKIIGIGREVVARRKDGTLFPMELSVADVRLNGQRLFTALVRDISERKQAEAALRESEQRLRAILETAVEGIITIDERGTVESINPAACRTFGYEPREVIGQNVSRLMPSPDRERHDDYIANYLRTGEAKIIGIGREVFGRRKDGSHFPMDLSISEVRLGERRLFTGLVRDITERRKLEQAVATAAEHERSRIGRELHDGLGQQLGGLLFLMKGLQSDLQSGKSRESVDAAGQLCDELTIAMMQARNLAHELYAVRAGPDGLVQALENLVVRVATAPRGIAIAFPGDRSVSVHSSAVASHLYRIGQEAVHNALKHSRATRIDIELKRQPDMVALTVRDNGIGLPAQSDSHGLGLRTMEQRARLMGGSLHVQVRPEGGVEVMCSVPSAIADGIGIGEGI